MINTRKYSFWFVTGSQDLYGEDTLKQVALDSKEMVNGLNDVEGIKYEIIHKPTVRNAKEIYDKQQIMMKVVLVLLLGCTHFHQLKCG